MIHRRLLLAVLAVLCASAVMAPPALANPYATTGNPHTVQFTTATVTGEVGDSNPPPPTPVQWYFEYGKTNMYGSSTPATDHHGGPGVSRTLENLEHNTTYNYRVVAVSRGQTAYGLNKTFTTQNDSDGDGFYENDTCPGTPGAANGYPGPGCPANTDTDGDGFPRDGPNSDRCPNEAGAAESPNNTRGCPPFNRDGDGYPDHQDPCPDAPGGAAGPHNAAGCPAPPDSDGDGFIDSADNCRDQAGGAAGPHNHAGCPAPPDADGDGHPDERDRCPTTPGDGTELSPTDNPSLPRARPGCPRLGTPTIRTEPVQITGRRILFTATANTAGRDGTVKFETSLTEGFRGTRELLRPGPCFQIPAPNDIDINFPVHTGNPNGPREAWYRDTQVTCLVDDTPHPEAVGTQVDHMLSWAKRGKVYVRAVLTYDDDENRTREIFGRTLELGGDGSGASAVRTLSTALTPKGKAAKIGQILKTNGFTAPFTCPATGRAAVTWSVKVKGKTVVVATGAAQCALAAGTSPRIVASQAKSKLKIALTKNGKALLKKAKQAKLTTQTSFTPKGGKKVSVNGTLTLKR